VSAPVRAGEVELALEVSDPDAVVGVEEDARAVSVV
jgi:hypothetical protein